MSLPVKDWVPVPEVISLPVAEEVTVEPVTPPPVKEVPLVVEAIVKLLLPRARVTPSAIVRAETDLVARSSVTPWFIVTG
jgi:hypothetical protein